MMQRSPSPNAPRALRTWLSTPLGRILLGAGVLLVAAALAVPTIAFVRMMSPSEQAPASQSQISQARVGDPIRAVVELDHQDGSGAFVATFLQPQGSNSYQITGRRLRIELAPDLSVAMGDRSGLRPGAVVQVSGQVRAADAIEVHQATVLTGFVTVGR
jgi:hypothetical protein